jgi:hypothetical protein
LDLFAASPEELGHSRHIDGMPSEPANDPGPGNTRISPAFSKGRRGLIIGP